MGQLGAEEGEALGAGGWERDQIADFVNKNHAGQKVVVLIKSDMLNPSEHQIDTLKEFSSRVQGQVTLLEPVVLQITDPSTLQPEDPESGEMPYIPSPEEELNAKKFNDKFKAITEKVVFR